MDDIVDRDKLIGWHEMYLAQLCIDRLLASPDQVTRLVVENEWGDHVEAAAQHLSREDWVESLAMVQTWLDETV